MKGFDEISEAVLQYHPNPDLTYIEKAFEFASKCHAAQFRANGAPYMEHIVETALLVCQLRLDLPSVAAALLHDTVEDCDVTKEDLEEEFGLDIAEIVEGVTKLTRLEFESKEENQIESFRKMLVAMSRDIRVLLVKLCDRLHNMRTLEHLRPDKQSRIATETKEIYAPLANRLGIHWLKSELEDLCFKYLRPELYKRIRSKFDQSKKERGVYIQETSDEIIMLLEAAGISASVTGRAKHFFSIWQKMEISNVTFEEVHDLLGFRIIVPTLRTCYETLGIIHDRYKPVPGRFKDYIAMPKPNMYQSLHTTVIGGKGHRIEVQIRTPEMNRVAEDGIAAHWRYKEGGDKGSEFDLQWVKELVDSQQYIRNPDEFIQTVKGELFPEEVFTFSPRGDLIRLPFGSTPVDFAYAIHTDVGHASTGARINGSIVPLSYKLENGDTVEILTSKGQRPSKDWLGFVKSSKAKQRIRAYLKALEHESSAAIGAEVLAKDLSKLKMSLRKLKKSGDIQKAAEALGFKGEDDLFAEIGYGKIGTTKIIGKLAPENIKVEEKLQKESTPLQKIFQKAASVTRGKAGVRVGGLDSVLVRFGKCCEPLPGDRIKGFITRGRGVTIHRADCSEILRSDPQRHVDVAWAQNIEDLRRIRLVVHAQDQKGMLADITKTITDIGADIKSAQIQTDDVGKAVISFEMMISNSSQLKNIIRGIERIGGVIKVERVKRN